MNPTLAKQIGGTIRHVLTTIGGALAAHGYVAEGDVETYVGAAMALIALGWSIYQKRTS